MHVPTYLENVRACVCVCVWVVCVCGLCVSVWVMGECVCEGSEKRALLYMINKTKKNDQRKPEGRS